MSKKKVTLVTNICIACVLCGLGIAIFTADLSNMFISVSAPVYNGDRSGTNVSFMFVVDDGVDEDALEALLDFFDGSGDNERIPATFFVGGKWADKSDNRRKLVNRMATDYEIGNHASSNKNLTKMSERSQYNEIALCHSIMYMITSANEDLGGAMQTEGVSMNLFLPPNGSFNNKTLKSAEKLGYRTVMWSRDARGSGIVTKAIGTSGNYVRGGDYILFDVSFGTLGAMSNIIPELRNNRGLDILPVSQNL